MQELEDELAKFKEPNEEQKAEPVAPTRYTMPEEEVKKVEELVDKLEQEIANINSSQDDKTEWHLAELALQSQ